jgi:solute carrier family 6 amino acid transporter-like protein 5/7/9/14
MFGDIHIWVNDYNVSLLVVFIFNSFLAFKNGGGKRQKKKKIQSILHIFSIQGAFIIPYFCIYFLVGTPLYFLELTVGQFTSSGATSAFKMSRMFKGICQYFE